VGPGWLHAGQPVCFRALDQSRLFVSQNHVCDSFEGLPPSSNQVDSDDWSRMKLLRVSRDEVNFASYLFFLRVSRDEVNIA
jgi:hypothetical protein